MRTIKLTLPLTLVLFAASMPSYAVEEAAYTVSGKMDDVEMRQYAPHVVAEVVVPGTVAEAGNQGFRILAGYIFGNNKGEHKLAMTAPVTQTAVPARQAASGGYVVQFVLPQSVTLSAAPQPIDPRITLKSVAPMRVAVIRYSGFWTDANYQEHLAQLEATLKKAGAKWSGEPIYSRYDPPFMPWFLRRNEIWLQVS